MDVFQSLHIPRQTPRKANRDGNMEALVNSYPPLGQVTLVEGTTAAFVVLLETNRTRLSKAWEVSLWHSHGLEWRESPLKPVGESVVDISMVYKASDEALSHRLYFTATIDVISPMSFTLRFRTAPDQPWRWVKDQQETIDGTILSKSKIYKSRTEDLHDLIKNLNPVVEAKKVLSQSPDTAVWSVTTPVPAADGEKSAMINVNLGLPWAGEVLRYGHSLKLYLNFYN